MLSVIYSWPQCFNKLRPRQNAHHFSDDIFKCIFLNENVWIFIKISLKFVPKVPINNIPAWVQKMAWCRLGDKSLSEPMLVSLLTHIRITRPQWVKSWSKTVSFGCNPYIYVKFLAGYPWPFVFPGMCFMKKCIMKFYTFNCPFLVTLVYNTYPNWISILWGHKISII